MLSQVPFLLKKSTLNFIWACDFMWFDVFKQFMYTLLCDLYFRHIWFTQKKTRRAHNYVRDIIGPHLQDNSKQFYGYIKSKKQESAGVAALRDQQGYLHSDSETKAHLLNMQFKSVYIKMFHDS
jgi:hypothetical protein